MNDPNIERKFIQLVNENQGIIHKICSLYCQDEEHRKDLFQEILIQLWQSYSSYRGEAKFSSWMYRVGLNVAIQDFRKVKKRHQFFFYTNEFKEQSDGMEMGQSEEKLGAMHRAIADLNRVEKAIIMLYLDGKSHQEIAEIVGIKQNYVRVKMSRIKTKLSQRVKK